MSVTTHEHRPHDHTANGEQCGMADEHCTMEIGEIHAIVRNRLERTRSRYTEQRRQLIETLATAGRPITLPEIASALPAVPHSSTYRNLDVLERAGAVNRITIGADRAYFELAEPLHSHHHHLICIGCGAIENLHLTDEFERNVEEHLAAAARRAGFTSQGHTLDVRGYCSKCSAGGYLGSFALAG